MARIYQDTEFIIEHISGAKVVELKGLVDMNSPDNTPILVNLKPERENWFRFFLDAGLAFWEEWEGFDDEPDEETREIDYAEKYNLRNKKIKMVRCVNSTISIMFEGNQEFILKFKDENDIDSGSEIVFEP